MKKVVFISHINEEAPVAEVLKDWIESSFLGQCDVFVSTDPDSIPAGSKWLEEIDQALESGTVFLVLCSPISLNRPWINFEIGCGWIKRASIIPICHSGQSSGTLPQPISMFQALELGTENFVLELLSSIAKHFNYSKIPKIDKNEMEQALAAAVRTVTPSEATSTTEQKILELPIDLPEECVKILEFLARLSGHLPTAEELANQFQMPLQRMKYYLDRLTDTEMIYGHLRMGSPTTYSVGKAGRKFLVESGLI